ncbi:MAG: histidine kinase [Aeromicrobium sp.]
MDPDDYQPRLRWWSHAWRYALATTVGFLGWIELGIWQFDHDPAWLALDLALGFACLVLVVWRRRFPLQVALITGALSAISGFAAGAATLALVSLATRRRWREIIPAGLVNLAGALALDWMNPTSQDEQVITWPIIFAAIAVTIALGMYVGSRRELLATLRERANTSEVVQAARVEQARAAERAQIAREMHDVLAHRISLVTMHAGALTYRRDLNSDQMRATAEVIQENSHQAMVELREVLGLLREGPGDSAPELPQPSATDLPALLDEARQAGMRVESHLIDLGGIPETLGRTVYRIVQEGLTNARKHAPNTLVSVSLQGGATDGLRAELRNPLPIGSTVSGEPESGLGLIGLAERTALAGGVLTHRLTTEQEFVLSAWLPWQA